MTCKLCQINEADKLNSHIISDFLLRSMLVQDNRGGRSDKIINTTITSTGSSFYIGRGIGEAQLSGLLGRNLTEEELRGNKNPYTVDNLLCSSCEQKLSFIEQLFHSKLYKPLKESKRATQKIEVTNNIEIFKIFWISILWRCSVTKYKNFFLPIDVEERLRLLITSSMGESVAETIQMILSQSINIKNELIGLLYMDDIKDPTSAIVYCSDQNEPFSLIINEFYLTYFLNLENLANKSKNLIGLPYDLEHNDYISTPASNIKILAIGRKGFNQIRSYFYNELAKHLIQFGVESFVRTHLMYIGSYPTNEIVEDFKKEYTSGNIGLLERYSIPSLKLVITKIIRKYYFIVILFL